MANITTAAPANVTLLAVQPLVASAAALESVKAAASFDFCVLAQTWQPYFCTTGNFPGCKNPSSFMSTQLTIHGLWPNYNSGGYPSNCGGASLSQSNINAAGASNVAKYWPDVKTNGWTFVANEWTKHGTCSGLDATSYVKAAINVEIQRGTPSIISSNVGSTVSSKDLLNAYGSTKVALICVGSDNALSEVRTCYNKAYSQIACPSTILNEGTCSTKSTVSIYSF
ncbi:hypothetical protein AC1031_020472 [Aphanomyces cochlioides]|nr:hypothetical protein AC1031_020472 [Aphanomyces cochlioides]